MKSRYTDQLRDPRWQKMRLLVLDREKFTCQRCKSTTKTLNVHHTYYERGRAPWEYEPESLRVLCEDCHLSTHERIDELHSIIAAMDPTLLEYLVGYLRCFSLIWANKYTDATIRVTGEDTLSGAFAALAIRDVEGTTELIQRAVASGRIQFHELIDLAVEQATQRRKEN